MKATNGTNGINGANGINGTHESDLEPIAIVGMGCRWPGGVTTPSELWQMLLEKRSAQSDVPAERFNIDSFYHPDQNRPGSVVAKGGYFLSEDPRQFDPSFFSITPLEANTLDPMHRKFLETVFEAFESAGVTLEELSGSKTGCFVGNFNYDANMMQYRDPEYLPAYAVTGTGVTIISNRVNYVFNLTGPSLTVDTACSSSMYALHIACEALRNGDCTAAIVGGTNIIHTVEPHMGPSKIGALSPTSTCHTFDAAADGYARGDGIAALYIKRLSDAVRDSDPIRAVIRGTSFNANGRTGGITHPSPTGQEACILQAYNAAGLNPNLTGYFECHGTGTPVGDPLEASAVSKVFSEGREPGSPLLIGSIKTNIGHTEPSSGMAGIMKALLALEHDQIPATIGLKNPNPEIKFDEWKLKVVQDLTPFPPLPVKRASINSFGYGGANAHVILESAQSYLPSIPLPKQRNSGSVLPSSDRRQFLLPFSAHDATCLSKIISNLQEVLDKYDLLDVAYTLSEKRTKFSKRAYAVIEDGEIKNYLNDDKLTYSRKSYKEPPSLVFVFTGQGAQWPQMGLELMTTYPSFLKTIQDLDAILKQCPEPPSWTLQESIRADAATSNIQTAALSQPVCTAVQIAIIDLLASFNIHPHAVVGHSSGELAAAYVAGNTSKATAIVSAYYRGLHVSAHNTAGAMLAVGLGAKDVAVYTNECPRELVVACENSPESTTISGDAEAVNKLKAKLDERGIFARVLKTGGKAYHSHHMKAIGAAYQASVSSAMERLGAQKPRKIDGKVLMVSSVTGKVVAEGESLGASYWRSNLEGRVRFDTAMRKILDKVAGENTVMVEVGPHPALAGPFRHIKNQLSQNEKIQGIEYFATLVRDSNSVSAIHRLCGNLFLRNHSVDLSLVNAIETMSSAGSVRRQKGQMLVDLPRYPWNYKRLCWSESRLSKEWRLRPFPRHDILGSLLPGCGKNNLVWRNRLSVKDVPWLAHHKIQAKTVFPAAGYIAAITEAMLQLCTLHDISDVAAFRFKDVSLKTALVIPEEDQEAIEVLYTIKPQAMTTAKSSEKWFEFTMSALNDDTWTEHCFGTVALEAEKELWKMGSPVEEGFLLKKANIESWYETFESVGLCYDTTFRCLSSVSANRKQQAAANIVFDSTNGLMKQESRYLIHPATIDCCLQLGIIGYYTGDLEKATRGFLPVTIEDLVLRKPIGKLEGLGRVHAWGESLGMRAIQMGCQLSSAEKEVVMEIRNLRCVSLEGAAPVRNVERSPYLRLVWKPDISTLGDKKAQELFPPPEGTQSEKIIHIAERAALCVIVQTIDAKQYNIKNLETRRLYEWLQIVVEEAAEGVYPFGNDIVGMSFEELEKEFTRLLGSLPHDCIEITALKLMHDNFSKILDESMTGLELLVPDETLAKFYGQSSYATGSYVQLANIVDLLGHQNPKMEVLEIGAGTGGATKTIMDTLQGETQFKRYKKYVYTDMTTGFLDEAQRKFGACREVEYKTLDIEKDPRDQGFEDGSFDLIVAANVLHATPTMSKTMNNVRRLLKPGGKLLLVEVTKVRLTPGIIAGTLPNYWSGYAEGRTTSPFLTKPQWSTLLQQTGFSGLDVALNDYPEESEVVSVLLSSATEEIAHTNGVTAPEVTFINRTETPGAVSLALEKAATSRGWTVHQRSFDSRDIVPGARVIVLAELEEAMMIKLTPEEWASLQFFVKTVSTMIWVTNGRLLTGIRPELSITHGLARAIMTEEPSFIFATLDFESDILANFEEACGIILTKQDELGNYDRPVKDMDFREKNGAVYISRLAPDNDLNEGFLKSSDTEAVPTVIDAEKPVQVEIGEVGLIASMAFREDTCLENQLEKGEIVVKTKSAAVNMHDLAVILGQYDQHHINSEVSGVIARVGPGVTEFKVGDKVLCAVKGNYGTYHKSTVSLAVKLDEKDDFEELSTMPVVFMTAILALMRIARLQKGESFLVQSAAGGLGNAAIQIAKMVGAKIFATVSNNEKRAFLTNTHGIPDDQIFYSRDSTFVAELMSKTSGRGVDVILNTSAGELLAETWRCIAPMGRFIDVARRDVLDHGKLAMEVFKRNAIFASIDLAVIADTQPELAASLLKETMNFYRQGLIKPITPVTKFSIEEIEDAFLMMTKGKHMGKILITYDKPQLKLKMLPTTKPLHLKGDASYLLVGGLGGLGMSLAERMVDRGAKHLIFLSRSGKDKPDVAPFLKRLETRGVEVYVVKGDVVKREDVDKAVKAAPYPVRGVIQSSMVLRDQLFASMSLEEFHAVTQPKVEGTINLHEALLNEPLDFFTIFSSVAGMLGTATQTNYAAANAFQDTFARYRHSLGLPVCSLALGQVLDVGYVSGKPEIVKALKRNGLYGIPECEYLGMAEAAMKTQKHHKSRDLDEPSRAHLVTGVEPLRLNELTKKGWSGGTHWHSDPRFGPILAAAAENYRKRNASPSGSGAGTGNFAATDSIGNIATTPPEEALKMIQKAFVERLSKLLFIPAEEIDEKRSVAEYGMDSMIAAVLRNWLWKTFAADVSFLELLGKHGSIEKLSVKLWEAKTGRSWSSEA